MCYCLVFDINTNFSCKRMCELCRFKYVILTINHVDKQCRERIILFETNNNNNNGYF